MYTSEFKCEKKKLFFSRYLGHVQSRLSHEADEVIRVGFFFFLFFFTISNDGCCGLWVLQACEGRGTWDSCDLTPKDDRWVKQESWAVNYQSGLQLERKFLIFVSMNVE